MLLTDKNVNIKSIEGESFIRIVEMDKWNSNETFPKGNGNVFNETIEERFQIRAYSPTWRITKWSIVPNMEHHNGSIITNYDTGIIEVIIKEPWLLYGETANTRSLVPVFCHESGYEKSWNYGEIFSFPIENDIKIYWEYSKDEERNFILWVENLNKEAKKDKLLEIKLYPGTVTIKKDIPIYVYP